MGAIPVRNPRTGEVDFRIDPAEPRQVEQTAGELRAAQPGWWHAGMEHRVKSMREWADELDRQRNQVAEALAVDTGRRKLAVAEVLGVAANIRRWCERAPRMISSEIHDSSVMPTLKFCNQFVPYQLVGVISPWNFPLTLSLIDAIPALLAGCTVVIKPSEVTPRFAEPLARTIDAAPGMAEVVRLIHGGGETGRALIDNVDAICFTGSVPTGRKVAVAAAENFVPAFLELGGKDPAVILPGANLEEAADAVLRGAALGTGQVCLALERIYVHESEHDEFVDLLVERAEKLELNYPDIELGDLGPIIFDRQAAIIDEHIDDAVSRGAEIRTGGNIENLDGGLYCRATVLTGVDHSMKVMRDETFGPLMPVMKYSTVEEAVALANDTEYGLSAAVFGPNREEAVSIAEQVNAGGLSVNDGALTRETYEAEKNSFGLSGMGGSRMGDAGFMRFFRKKALLIQTGKPAAMV